METQHKFWSGRITTPEHAEVVLNAAVAGFGFVFVLMCLALLMGVDASKLTTVALFGAPVLGLHLAKSRIAAGALLVLYGICSIAAVVGLVAIVQTEGPVGLFAILILPLPALGAAAAWRTLAAARVYHRKIQVDPAAAFE